MKRAHEECISFLDESSPGSVSSAARLESSRTAPAASANIVGGGAAAGCGGEGRRERRERGWDGGPGKRPETASGVCRARLSAVDHETKACWTAGQLDEEVGACTRGAHLVDQSTASNGGRVPWRQGCRRMCWSAGPTCERPVQSIFWAKFGCLARCRAVRARLVQFEARILEARSWITHTNRLDTWTWAQWKAPDTIGRRVDSARYIQLAL